MPTPLTSAPILKRWVTFCRGRVILSGAMIALLGIKRFLSIFSQRINPPLQVIDPVSVVRVVTLVRPGANLILISLLLAIDRVLLPVLSRIIPVPAMTLGAIVLPNNGRILVPV